MRVDVEGDLSFGDDRLRSGGKGGGGAQLKNPRQKTSFRRHAPLFPDTVLGPCHAWSLGVVGVGVGVGSGEWKRDRKARKGGGRVDDSEGSREDT
jgi:hypothetical protein